MAVEAIFPAMGTTAHVVVTGGDDRILACARERIADLESRWSRFLPTSEISRLNGCAELPVVVSPETFLLVERAVAAWHATGGRYDPTVLPALRDAGYDRDFPLVGDGPVRQQPVAVEVPPTGTVQAASRAVSPPTVAAPGCGAIGLDRRRRAVRLPAGVELDPGGIGKGLAADLVTAELAEAGAAGSLVNLGGDLRVRGQPPDGGSWSIGVENPRCPGEQLMTFGIDDGAVATSSRLRRRWTRDGRPYHHLIDPQTGRPSASSLLVVTAVASEAWWAEAVAKSVFVAGVPASQAEVAGALVATVDGRGTLDVSPGLARVAS